MSDLTASPPSLEPDIRLYGRVDVAMLSEFLRQQAQAPAEGPLLLELSTEGGDADIGRRIATELRLWQACGREVHFLGKAYVYSAGVTVMAAIPWQRRVLCVGTQLLIHERRLKRELQLTGPLSVCAAMLRNAMAEIETGQRLEAEGFAALVEGTSMSVEELQARVLDQDWYLAAESALALGLVAEVI